MCVMHTCVSDCSCAVSLCVCFMQCFYICNSCHAIYEIVETQNDIGTTRRATTTTGTDGSTAALVASKTKAYEFALPVSLSLSLSVCSGQGVSWWSSWNRTKQSRRTHTLSMFPDYIVLCHTIEIYIYLIAYQVRRFTLSCSAPPLLFEERQFIKRFFVAINF